MRRYHLLAILCSVALLSCSNDSPVGSEPSIPATPSPADESENQPSSLTLSWSGEGGVHYDLHLGMTSNPPLVAHDLSVPHYQPDHLKAGSRFYWRVVNIGADGSVAGPEWTFTTLAGIPPVGPSGPGPADGATVVRDSVDLTWSPPPGDSLTYNVYFGTQTAPPLARSDVKVATYSAAVLGGRTYYWRIETKNRDDITSGGPTWHFQAVLIPGHIYNVAGTGANGFGKVQQSPLATQLNLPQDISFDASGLLVVVDWNNHRVLGTDPGTGTFYLIAGSGDGKPGSPCPQYPAACDDILAPDSPLNHPTSVTFRSDGMMVVSAWKNSSVFLDDIGGKKMSRIAGTGKGSYDGEDKAANASGIYHPSASVYDLQGRLIFTDQANMIIRMIDANGVVHRFAGTAPVLNGTTYTPQSGFSGDEGPATSARFNWNPDATCGKLCIDAVGNIYVADTSNHAVRVIDTSGVIHRFAGLHPASQGFSGDGGAATAARLNSPRDVACDGDGNVFICDSGNQVIRMVAPDGIITTVAGIPGFTGHSQQDGKLATESGLNLPYGIEIDAQGNLWIADTYNGRIRVVYRVVYR